MSKKPEVFIVVESNGSSILLGRSDDPTLVRETIEAIQRLTHETGGKWAQPSREQVSEIQIPAASASDDEKIEMAKVVADAFIEAAVSTLSSLPGMTRKLALGEVTFRANRLYMKEEYSGHAGQDSE